MAIRREIRGLIAEAKAGWAAMNVSAAAIECQAGVVGDTSNSRIVP
jgi:hypothetical protein